MIILIYLYMNVMQNSINRYVKKSKKLNLFIIIE